MRGKREEGSRQVEEGIMGLGYGQEEDNEKEDDKYGKRGEKIEVRALDIKEKSWIL